MARLGNTIVNGFLKVNGQIICDENKWYTGRESVASTRPEPEVIHVLIPQNTVERRLVNITMTVIVSQVDPDQSPGIPATIKIGYTDTNGDEQLTTMYQGASNVLTRADVNITADTSLGDVFVVFGRDQNPATGRFFNYSIQIV